MGIKFQPQSFQQKASSSFAIFAAKYDRKVASKILEMRDQSELQGVQESLTWNIRQF